MAHVVFCWELGAGLGHLVPIRCLAGGFIARGHRVTAWVRDVARGQAMLAPLGIQVRPVPRITPPPHDFPLSFNYADNLWRNGYWRPDALGRALAEWRQTLADAAPDLLIADHAPTALLSSRDAGYPRAAIGMGFTLPPLVSPMPGLQPWFPLPDARLLEHETRFLSTTNTALTRLGLPEIAAPRDIFAGVERFLCAFPELDHYADRGEAVWWGPLFESSALPSPTWPIEEGAGVFVYLSAENRFLTPVLSHLAASKVPVLAYIRGQEGPIRGPVIATNIRYLDGAVDLEAVASRCRVAVTQGGFGSLAVMLARGVPLLICPLELEQALLGWRLARRGLVASLSLFAPEADVTRNLERLLDAAVLPPGLSSYRTQRGNHDPEFSATAIVTRCELHL